MTEHEDKRIDVWLALIQYNPSGHSILVRKENRRASFITRFLGNGWDHEGDGLYEQYFRTEEEAENAVKELCKATYCRE